MTATAESLPETLAAKTVAATIKVLPENPVYFYTFACLVFVLALLSYVFRSKPETLDKSSSSFNSFKLNYLVVYSLVIMSDWLQGPYVYILYKSYGYDTHDIATLFVAGFLSSAVFGTYVGSIADKFGRRRLGLVFCIVYIISCITKLYNVYNILMLGRILGGIATSLLFSVFEAWMVSEFYSRGFKEELLSDIFGWSTFLNGLIAILSGVVANFLVDLFGRGSLGYVMPFMASIVVLVFSFLVVFFTWKENYGQGSTNSTKQSGSNIWNAISEIRNDRKTFAVGVMQCCFESAMYTFVFMWSPALEKIASEKTSIPFGLVFASFMVSIMIGSLFFRILSNHHSNENIARMAFALSTVSFMMCIVNIKTEFLLFFWFNVFECSCGIYFPSVGTMRGKYVKEETRATVMNVFRVPLNLIVVVSLLKVDSMAFSSVFLICACSNIIGFACSHAMVSMAGNGSKAVPTAGQDEYEI